MLTSLQLDAAMRNAINSHVDDDGECAKCGELWPCQYVIQVSISMKLSAIAQILSADVQTINTIGAGAKNGARESKGFQGS